MTEFYPWDKYPDTAIPRPGRLARLICALKRFLGQEHTWRKWYWGGVDSMFDADMCYYCHKMKGPLPLERTTPDFPCTMNPY